MKQEKLKPKSYKINAINKDECAKKFRSIQFWFYLWKPKSSQKSGNSPF